MESVGRNDWKLFKSYPLSTRFFDWWLNLYNTNSVIKLFYTYTVTKDGKAIGEMEMAASKVLGCIMHRMILSKPLDRDSMKQKAIDIVKKEYPGWELRFIKLVCYSYPMEG